MKRETNILFIIIFMATGLILKGQENNQLPDVYQRTYDFINRMLTDKEPLDFTNAVFATENAYYDGTLNIVAINQELAILHHLVDFISVSQLITYEGKDKETITKHAALFKVITDSISIPFDSIHNLVYSPYTYDFDDVMGQSDWTKMFVSKLLETGKGNCHSLPYLYKILSDELNIPCYLSFAPNHIYIKLFSETTGWYNTELTSASFPIDAWIIASGYVNIDAIRNGLYMDTLSNKQAVANCLLDLAQGYQHKYGRENPGFVVKCCNTVLQYHPTNVNAVLPISEAQKFYIHALMKAKNIKKPEALFAARSIKEMYAEMEETYVKLHQLGYRQMPEEVYRQWMGLLKNEPVKYINTVIGK